VDFIERTTDIRRFSAPTDTITPTRVRLKQKFSYQYTLDPVERRDPCKIQYCPTQTVHLLYLDKGRDSVEFLNESGLWLLSLLLIWLVPSVICRVVLELLLWNLITFAIPTGLLALCITGKANAIPRVRVMRRRIRSIPRCNSLWLVRVKHLLVFAARSCLSPDYNIEEKRSERRSKSKHGEGEESLVYPADHDTGWSDPIQSVAYMGQRAP